MSDVPEGGVTHTCLHVLRAWASQHVHFGTCADTKSNVEREKTKKSDYFDATESSKPKEIAGDPQGCSKDHDDSKTIAKAPMKHALGYRSEWQVGIL